MNLLKSMDKIKKISAVLSHTRLKRLKIVHKIVVFKEQSLKKCLVNTQLLRKKIVGRKRPALVVPSHKVHQGGKGSIWDGQTDGHFWTDRRKV